MRTARACATTTPPRHGARRAEQLLPTRHRPSGAERQSGALPPNQPGRMGFGLLPKRPLRGRSPYRDGNRQRILAGRRQPSCPNTHPRLHATAMETNEHAPECPRKTIGGPPPNSLGEHSKHTDRARAIQASSPTVVCHYLWQEPIHPLNGWIRSRSGSEPRPALWPTGDPLKLIDAQASAAKVSLDRGEP